MPRNSRQISHKLSFQQDTKEYLNRGVPKAEFPGVKKGGTKGEVKRGEVVWESEQGLKGKEGGKNEGKRMGGEGPESTLEKLWFWYP